MTQIKNILSYQRAQRRKAAKYIAKKNPSVDMSTEALDDVLRIFTENTLAVLVNEQPTQNLYAFTTLGVLVLFQPDTYQDRDKIVTEVVWTVQYFVDPAVGKYCEWVEKQVDERKERIANSDVVSIDSRT